VESQLRYVGILLALRGAARRPTAQGRNRFFAFPAFALQLASSPRDRAGLLPAVPLRRTGFGCGERGGITAFAKGAKNGAPWWFLPPRRAIPNSTASFGEPKWVRDLLRGFFRIAKIRISERAWWAAGRRQSNRHFPPVLDLRSAGRDGCSTSRADAVLSGSDCRLRGCFASMRDSTSSITRSR